MDYDVKDRIIKDLNRRLLVHVREPDIAEHVAARELLKEALVEFTGKTVLAYKPYTKQEIDIAPLKFDIISNDIRTAVMTPYDVLIVPMFGYMKDGYRLGRGGGFYDKLIANNPTKVSIGVAFSKRLVYFLPEEHDQRVDILVTDKEIIDLRKDRLQW